MDEDRVEALIDIFGAGLMARFDALDAHLDRAGTKIIGLLDEEKAAWEQLLAEAVTLREKAEETNRLLVELRERSQR